MSEGERRTADADESPGALVYIQDIVSSAGAVLLVGALLFAVSGVWPPLVAIESGSMDPHIQKGDLVFVMDEERFVSEQARHGVVTAQASDQYVQFTQPGDVIVYAPDGDNQTTPIIHRAMFWVEEGENWYDKADQSAIGGAQNCADLANCPAKQAGFITKGDNNRYYDQVGASTISDPVRPGWVVGTAEARVPYLGQVRLRWTGAGAERHDVGSDVTNTTSPTADERIRVRNGVAGPAVGA